MEMPLPRRLLMAVDGEELLPVTCTIHEEFVTFPHDGERDIDSFDY
jgi:hypothetical protein